MLRSARCGTSGTSWRWCRAFVARLGCRRWGEVQAGLHRPLLVTLHHLRHGATHNVLACWFGVDGSTITRAIGEVRPLLATRGCAISMVCRRRR
ncbi:helix-turn-helix domain-containing protein [Streptomyces sp. H39-C1]|uniref:helix-turn-helix domain-containing protein n=1 Tax=Streptomyces sp. H39-C1 TaxID=3004355 RepID=UPI001E300F94|nr:MULTISPECIES: transposase family protein [unclassified Streptomyces]MCZ4101730.1 transposase family protein [Streptomyces sp. H39-C1]